MEKRLKDYCFCGAATASVTVLASGFVEGEKLARLR
jgi:hypothetical protein